MFLDRQTARMSIGRIERGAEKGDYLIFNVGDALHILQYGENDAVAFPEFELVEFGMLRIPSRWCTFDEMSVQCVIALQRHLMKPTSL